MPKTERKSVDLNCDCGEGFGPYQMGDDAAMLDIVTSANVACGFHAGDPRIMAETFHLARQKNVAIGAHPGFADLSHFGRRPLPCTTAEVEHLIAYQVGAAMGLAALSGHKITHVKPHGALSNLACADRGLADAIARAIKSIDPDLIFLVISGTELEQAGLAQNLPIAREIFADRAYAEDGQLLSRSLPGAVLHEPDIIAARIRVMVEEGAVISISGKHIPVGIDSICVHGDTPGAVAAARAVRRALEEAGISLKSFCA
ncbi:LamB/YcsF family protein [Beijerinckia indica]|uniref:5-oxoprolinase subunit A n=1 Tax=Beijerinckia indica subsp. indica (strain ATCC 9039 / DSM 1715 / NCIMB 8712) TaxID=395963 RepID=B2ICA4_BEII9|nr:5-oxoprolinase subunit PxpA [Beijerinckia indica]ACB96701.1 LamB/YcsF family protein [Beijerinckia indica subsp. indica ATCC 9039]